MDTYIRRENLKFSGIPEEQNESSTDTQRKIRECFNKNLGLANSQKIEFQRCHRLGSRSAGNQKSRDIIVRFLRYQDRMDVWNCRSKLKGSQIFLQEDFPAEIEQRRRKLYPIYKEAKKTRNNIFLVADKLIIDGMRYTILWNNIVLDEN